MNLGLLTIWNKSKMFDAIYIVIITHFVWIWWWSFCNSHKETRTYLHRRKRWCWNTNYTIDLAKPSSQLWSQKWRYLSFQQISKGIHVLTNEKTQGSPSDKCVSNKKNKSTYHLYHKKHKNSLDMACKNQTKDKRKQIAPMSNKMNTHKKCIPWVF